MRNSCFLWVTVIFALFTGYFFYLFLHSFYNPFPSLKHHASLCMLLLSSCKLTYISAEVHFFGISSGEQIDTAALQLLH